MNKTLKKFITATTMIAVVCSVNLTFAEDVQNLSPPEETFEETPTELNEEEITDELTSEDNSDENLSEEEHTDIEEEITDELTSEDNSDENLSEEEQTDIEEEITDEDITVEDEEQDKTPAEEITEVPMLFSRRPSNNGSDNTQQNGTTVHHLDIRINKVEVDVLDQNGNHVTTYPYASITNVHSAIITKSDGTSVTVPGSYFLQSSDGGSGDPEFDATITTDNQKEKYIDLGLTYDDITSIEFIIDLKVSKDDINYESYTNLSFVMGDAELTAAKELCYNDNPNAGVHGYDFVFENPVNITVQETPESEPPEEEHESYFPTLVPSTGDTSIINSNIYAFISVIALVLNNKKYKKF